MNSNTRFLSADSIQGVESKRNYIVNNQYDKNISPWVLYKGGTTSPTTGTGGTPDANFAISRNANSNLFFGSTLRLVKDVTASRQGNGFSYEFTIENADQTKPFQIEFDYQIVSGTFTGSSNPITNSDLTVWIYDVTNTTLIQPAAHVLDGAVVGQKYTYRGNFQTTTGTTYRLIIHCSTTATPQYTLDFDNFRVSRNVISMGTIVTDWVSYTPTVTTLSGTMTNFVASGLWRRVGDEIELKGTIRFTGTAGTWSGPRMSLPSGLSIDFNKANSYTGESVIRQGSGSFFDSGTANYAFTPVAAESIGSNLIAFNPLGTNTSDAGSTTDPTLQIGTSSVSSTYPFTFGTDDVILFSGLTLPIQGWGSNVAMSSDMDNRIILLRANKITGNHSASGSDQTVASWTTLNDTHGAFNATTGIYTAPVSGYYRVSGSIGFAANATGLRWAYVTGTYTSPSRGGTIQTATANTMSVPFEDTVYCNAGQTISISAFQNTGGNLDYSNDSRFSSALTIERVSGPAIIASTEFVGVEAHTVSTTILSSTTDNIMVFTTKIKDTHSAYNSSTGVFTAPISGYYTVSWLVTGSVNLSTSQRFLSVLRKNNIDFKFGSRSNGTGVTNFHSSGSTYTIYLNAGEDVRIACRSSVDASTDPATAACWLTIFKADR